MSTSVLHAPAPAPTAVRLRVLVATVCAVVLALAGATLPARAADAPTISGRVILPAGTSHTGVSMGVWRPGDDFDGAVTRPVPLSADGSFSITLPTNAGPSYLVRLETASPSTLASGWHVSGATVTARRDAATAVAVGSTDVVVRAVAGVSVSGRVVLPAGVPGFQRVSVEEAAWAWSWVVDEETTVADDGSFVVDRLVPGGDYRIRLLSSSFYAGYLRTDGTWGPRQAASTFSAPRSGMVLRPNPSGTITGRVELPAGVRDQFWVEAFYADGVQVESALTEADGSFELDDLDTGRAYRLRLDGRDELVDGYYTSNGTLAPTYAQGSGVRPGTEVTLRPVVTPGVRGRVELPAGFTFGPDASGSVQVHRQRPDGRWQLETRVGIRDDGTFSAADLTAGTEYRAYLELNGQVGGVRSGWWTGDATATHPDDSRAQTVAAGPSTTIEFRQPLVASKAPAVWGSTALGGTLSASRGTWEAAPTGYRFQWLRHGRPIAGATSSRYKVTKADLGLNLSVQVVASSAERPQGVARSAVVRVPKATPKVSISVPKSATYGQPVTVTARVTTSGVSTVPSGTVRVSYAGGSRTVGLRYADQGRVTVRLTGLTRGTHTVRAVYTPSAVMKKYVTTGTSAPAALRVR